MQQYKFRGKRKDNGEWAYGSYVSTPALPLADSKHLIFEFTGIESGEPIFDVHEVMPETVGMFLFMNDVKGNNVYDGDILSGRFGTGHGGKSIRYKTMNFSIRFHKKFPEFLIDMPKGYGNYRFCPDIEDSEVIGNIHDHPHLLNPAKGAVINSMNHLDPNTQATNEEVKAEGQDLQATEQEAQEKAMESEEEGGTEG